MKLFYYALGFVSVVLGLVSLALSVKDGNFSKEEEFVPFLFLGGGFYLIISTAQKYSGDTIYVIQYDDD